MIDEVDKELERRITEKLVGRDPVVVNLRKRRRPGPRAKEIAAQRDAEQNTYEDERE